MFILLENKAIRFINKYLFLTALRSLCRNANAYFMLSKITSLLFALLLQFSLSSDITFRYGTVSYPRRILWRTMTMRVFNTIIFFIIIFRSIAKRAYQPDG